MRITLHRNAVHVAVAVVTVLTGAAGCTIPVVQTTTSVASSPTPANPSVMQPTTSPTTKTLSSSSPTRETKPSTTAEPSPKTYELANRSVTERLLLSGYPPTSPIVSPDGKRVAYFGKVESVRYHTVVVDSVEGKYYDNIDFQTLTFSPDSKHVAYFASFYSDKKYSLVVDGVEGQHYDRGDRVGGDSAMFPLGPEAVFSPDGQHVAYAAKLGNDSFVVADGVEGKHYLQIVSAPIYSPDSKHLAYAVQKQSTERATVKDGRVVIEGGARWGEDSA